MSSQDWFLKVGRGAVAAAVSRGMGVLVEMALLATLSRLAGVPMMGVYVMLLTLVNFASLGARAGLDREALRATAHGDGTQSSDRSRASSLRGIVTAAVWSGVVFGGVAGLLARAVLSPPGTAIDGNWMAVGLGIWVSAYTVVLVLVEILRGEDRILLATVLPQVIPGVVTIGGALVWSLNRTALIPLEAVIGLYAGGVALALGIGMMCVRPYLWPPGAGEEEGGRPGAVWRRPLPLALWVGSLSNFVLSRGDVWVAGLLLSGDAAGNYGAAARIVLLVGSALTIFNQAIPGSLGRLYHQGEKEKLERLTRRVATIASGAGSFLYVGLLVLGPLALEIVVGGGFLPEAYPVLIVLGAAQLIGAWVGPAGFTLIMTNGYRRYAWIGVSSAVCAVALGLFGGVLYGMIGLAAGYGVAYLGQQYGMLHFAQRDMGIWTAGYVKIEDLRGVWTSIR